MLRALALASTLAAIVFSGAASAQVTVPNTFAAGQPARAADVNANFQALATAINSLAARVSKLEGSNLTATDFVGTYTLNRLQTQLGGGTAAYVATYVASATLTFAADGTVTSADDTGERGHQLNVVTRVLSPFVTAGTSNSATWSYSGGKLVAFGQTLTVANGGRLLILAGVNPDDGTNVLVLLTRTN